MSTNARVPIDPASSRQIENLIARYAELLDDGDFAGVGDLFAEATFGGGGTPMAGSEEIAGWFRDHVIVYPDGTPRTQHVTTNIAIERDGHAENTAFARSYVTVLQALPEMPPQIIAAGRYNDRFECRDGKWRFTERRVDVRFFGDRSGHSRPAVKQA